jgi:predicted nuclease of predicted toxin-antitoxin system
MRFKIDENLHQDVAKLLIEAGHDAHTVKEEGLRGVDDVGLARHCIHEQRVLVTLDLDFADIRSFPPAGHTGLIVVRVADQSRRHVLSTMARAVDLLAREPVQGRLWIVSESGIRIRES